MGEFDSTTTRRALLGALTVGPIATLSKIAVASPWDSAIAALPYAEIDEPVPLRRSRTGRSDSRFRFHNAETFFVAIEKDIVRDTHDRLYQIGIVLQLGLSSHLLDIGFADEWCARNIGLCITRSLAYANATGFGFQSAEFDLLAAMLSPYGKWRFQQQGEREDFPFTPEQARTLTRTLLDHVHRVTGHPRPRGWNMRHV